MARFEARTPITTREPTIAVDPGLPVGRHRFRLEVIDAAGQRSAADEAVVEVQRIIIDPDRIPTPGPVIPTPGPITGPLIPTPGPITGPVIPTPPINRPTRSRTRRTKEEP
jgi:hypothetical protein